MSITAMKQALEALELYYDLHGEESDEKDIAALRTAIEQAEKQEPVALETVYETIIQWDDGGGKRSRRELARRIVALYTTPPTQEFVCSTGLCHYKAKREFVGLTDELRDGGDPMFHCGAKWAERKLKKKNTHDKV